jgi:hypothetical protein
MGSARCWGGGGGRGWGCAWVVCGGVRFWGWVGDGGCVGGGARGWVMGSARCWGVGGEGEGDGGVRGWSVVASEWVGGWLGG